MTIRLYQRPRQPGVMGPGFSTTVLICGVVVTMTCAHAVYHPTDSPVLFVVEQVYARPSPALLYVVLILSVASELSLLRAGADTAWFTQVLDHQAPGVKFAQRFGFLVNGPPTLVLLFSFSAAVILVGTLLAIASTLFADS